MWHCPTEGTYIVIERSGISIICPSEDTEPHTLEGFECKCNPEVTPDHEYLHVVHTRFTERAAIDGALSKLFT